MKNKFHLINKIVTVLLLLSLSGQSVAFAQGPQQEDKLRIGYNDSTGKVSFIGADPSQPISIRSAQANGLKTESRALAMISAYAADFGLKNPVSELKLLETEQIEGREVTRFQQVHQGVPIMGGEIIVNANDRAELLSLSGEISPELALDINPTISAKQAQITALELMAKGHQVSKDEFDVTTPELWIYDSRLFEPDSTKAVLVWRLEVKSKNNVLPINELVLVDARRGSIVLNFNQVDTAWETRVNLNASHETSGWMHGPDFDGNQPMDGLNKSVSYSFTSAFISSISTYTANNDTTLPGTFLCDQTTPLCTGGVNPDADSAHLFASEVFNYYDTNHNRNSIDNAGMTIISSVNYGSGYQNASWNGAQMLYGDGYSLADDVVGHELTHGVTQYESNLLYYYQSGAINESFSDVWGELYDQQNGLGDDSEGVKWLVGEDIPGGALRSMSNPTDYGDPDKMTSANYYTDEFDNGGVHTNSGINNKAAFLMADGGSFNGRTITALGASKTLAIYYEVQTNLLTSGSDYSDLYYALYQACLNLVGGAAGIVSEDCQQVRDTIDAVEMNLQPVANFNTDAPICAIAGQVPNNTFYDDLENGTSNWTLVNGANTRWQYDAPYGIYAHSGEHSLYADDYPAVPTDAYARLTSIVVPANAYLHFSHAYHFEAFDPYYFDGGVLEYSINNGASWVDAVSLMEYNGYKGTIYPSYDNPLKGRSAFVGSSHGYISTRLNLSTLAGKTVHFRWRMGLDTAGLRWGWWLDDVRVYTCVEGTPNVNVSMNGTVTGSYNIPDTSTRFLTYNGLSAGPVKVTNFNDLPILLSERVLFSYAGKLESYYEMMALPVGQLNTEYWYPYNTNSGVNTQLRVANAGNATANFEVWIAGTQVPGSPFSVATNAVWAQNFYTITGGPVQVKGTNGVPITSTQRFIFTENGVIPTSFAETMGLPAGELDTEYWFPIYNNLSTNSQLRIANAGASTATVDIYMGGIKRGETLSIPANSTQLVSFPGLAAGPVRIVSTGASPMPIVVTERVLFSYTNRLESYYEMMALPAGQLSTEYWYPYNTNSGVNTQLRFGNAGSTPAQVEVRIAGSLVGSYTVPVNAVGNATYYDIVGGPVQVRSTNGVLITSTQRFIFTENGVIPASFAETMGMPLEQLSDEYWFPIYNNLTTNSQLRLAAP
jgi:bacillolysin